MRLKQWAEAADCRVSRPLPEWHADCPLITRQLIVIATNINRARTHRLCSKRYVGRGKFGAAKPAKTRPSLESDKAKVSPSVRSRSSCWRVRFLSQKSPHASGAVTALSGAGAVSVKDAVAKRRVRIVWRRHQ